MRDTFDEMIYLSCLHHFSVLESFLLISGEHQSNSELSVWWGRALDTWPPLHELPMCYATYNRTDMPTLT